MTNTVGYMKPDIFNLTNQIIQMKWDKLNFAQKLRFTFKVHFVTKSECFAKSVWILHLNFNLMDILEDTARMTSQTDQSLFLKFWSVFIFKVLLFNFYIVAASKANKGIVFLFLG